MRSSGAILVCGLVIYYFQQLNEQCYGRRIRMKTVWLVHSTFQELIDSLRDVQK